jgi:hypothetical protein
LRTKNKTIAAIAICRASPDAWPKLTPIVLTHLALSRQGAALQDDERALFLALNRFGQ